jgi:uncharacterized protein YbjT (DUF2867 family)
MILVAGATGLLGGEVCRRLITKGHAVRALVRETSDSAKKQKLSDYGAATVTGDLKDRGSLLAACRGASAVISTASSTISRQPGDSIETVDHQGQLDLVKAAKANAIDRFIFVSSRHDPLNPSPLSDAKRAVERGLHDLNHTILQPSFFMEVWLSPRLGFDYANARVRIYGSGEGKVSWISFFDVAEFCVAVLDNKAAYRSTIELGGPEVLSPLQVVRIFEQESGRQYELERVSREALESDAHAATGSLEKSFVALMLTLSRGDEIDMRPVLEKFPLRLTSVRDYARKVSA